MTPTKEAAKLAVEEMAEKLFRMGYAKTPMTLKTAIIEELSPLYAKLSDLEAQLAAEASAVEVPKFAVGDKVVTYTSLTMGGKDEHQFTVRRISREIYVTHPDGYQMQFPFQESHLVRVEDIPKVLAALVQAGAKQSRTR